MQSLGNQWFYCTAQPPSKPSHSPCSGVDMMNEDQVVNPGSHVNRLRQASEEASHCSDKAAVRAYCGLLAELAGIEPENETVNQISAQILVATPLARRRRAPIDQRVDPGHLVGLARPPRCDDRQSDRAKLAAAPSPEGQVVSV